MTTELRTFGGALSRRTNVTVKFNITTSLDTRTYASAVTEVIGIGRLESTLTARHLLNTSDVYKTILSLLLKLLLIVIRCLESTMVSSLP
jgi:hypothetical protein